MRHRRDGKLLPVTMQRSSFIAAAFSLAGGTAAQPYKTNAPAAAAKAVANDFNDQYFTTNFPQ